MSNGRKPSRPQRRPAGPTPGPVRISTSGPALDEEREPLFYIDDREYTIPARVAPNFAIRYLNNIRKDGSETAVAQAMVDLLGEEAMDELAECPYVTEEQMADVMAIVEAKMMRAADKVLGNS